MELLNDYSLRGIKSLTMQTVIQLTPCCRAVSYPLVSGDTFRSCADEKIDDIRNLVSFELGLRKLRAER